MKILIIESDLRNRRKFVDEFSSIKNCQIIFDSFGRNAFSQIRSNGIDKLIINIKSISENFSKSEIYEFIRETLIFSSKTSVIISDEENRFVKLKTREDPYNNMEYGPWKLEGLSKKI